MTTPAEVEALVAEIHFESVTSEIDRNLAGRIIIALPNLDSLTKYAVAIFRMPPFAGKTVSQIVFLSGSIRDPREISLQATDIIGLGINLLDQLRRP